MAAATRAVRRRPLADDLESQVGQPGGEGVVDHRRPHCQDTAGAQGAECVGQTGTAVQPLVIITGQAAWSVVDIEEDLVVGRPTSAQQFADVADHHGRARIVQRMSRKMGERSAVPHHHRRHQLGDGQFAVLRQTA